LQILEDSRKYWLYQYCRYWKILKNTGNTSIADTGKYLLVLQILKNSGKYWDTSIYQYLYQYCRYWKILVKYW
jgi:hypothetical protein